VAAGFLHPSGRADGIVDTQLERLLQRMEQWQ